jgi:hypothetical protein
MDIIAYYEGDEAIKGWISKIIQGNASSITFKKLPTSNLSSEFTKLPAYVADILNLDKPDVILSGTIDGIHEKPLLSIELASCTPQYQHALQRFSRMMASVTNGCPSVVILPEIKRENSEGVRTYKRSSSILYGAVRLMDIFHIPAFVFDWPNIDGILQNEEGGSQPLISSRSMQELQDFVGKAVSAFNNLDYVEALWRSEGVQERVDLTRELAYRDGAPSISNPGGGTASGVQANLKIQSTSSLLDEISSRSKNDAKVLELLPGFIRSRAESLIFRPTRLMNHAGDPYVGMIGYYDVAFCRIGRSTRDRRKNLVAYFQDVSIDEIQDGMKRFNNVSCPFSNPIALRNIEQYSYHLKHGCRETKSKPIRIYSELADLLIFKDGVIFNAG